MNRRLNPVFLHKTPRISNFYSEVLKKIQPSTRLAYTSLYNSATTEREVLSTLYYTRSTVHSTEFLGNVSII